MNNLSALDLDDINIILDNEIDTVLDKTAKKIKTKTILVLSGGSFKGVAQLGALHCLKKHNLLGSISTIAATSVGSITGVLYCAGYSPMEVYKYVKLVNFDQCTKIDTNKIITKFGLDDGVRLIFVITKMLTAKGFDSDITFKQFYEKTKITFIVTGACVNDKKAYYFSHKTYPDMKVMDAVRISISIPVVFTPCSYEGKFFVDGGCIDNFPISLFSDRIDQVIGIYVTEKRKNAQEIKYVDDYLNNVLQCLYEGITYRETRNHANNVIQIRCTDSTGSQASMICMFDEGYRSALCKIKEWKSNS
jgi:NTE family protein